VLGREVVEVMCTSEGRGEVTWQLEGDVERIICGTSWCGITIARLCLHVTWWKLTLQIPNNVKVHPLYRHWGSHGRTARRGSRGIALLFHDHGTRRGWGVSVTPRPLFTPGKDSVPIVQEAGWAPGPVWTGAEKPNNVECIISWRLVVAQLGKEFILFWYWPFRTFFQPKHCSYLTQFKPKQISHPSLQEEFKIIFSFSNIAQGIPFLYVIQPKRRTYVIFPCLCYMPPQSHPPWQY
jgi:hypothetical protein